VAFGAGGNSPPSPPPSIQPGPSKSDPLGFGNWCSWEGVAPLHFNNVFLWFVTGGGGGFLGKVGGIFVGVGGLGGGGGGPSLVYPTGGLDGDFPPPFVPTTPP